MESVSYEFGAGRGLIQYQFPPGNQPDTEEDNIALGFITLKTDAILLRIESSNTQDYFELEIVEGNVFAVFNVGSQDLPLGEIGVKVNDNNYHVVRFTRRGGNATLQIDDYNVQNLHAQGHISTVFNSMSNIQVGGKVPKGASRSRIERAFAGVIAGLSINRLRILDLAAERDPQITIRGDVQLTPPSGYPGVMDDLIFSGAGSGCRGDDEDECMPPFENGSGDDLITPVYVPPTKQTVTQNKTKPNKSENEKLCDDEDCLHGSGSGEVTDSYSTPSVTMRVDSKDTSPDVSPHTTIDDKRTDTTMPDTTQPDEETIGSAGTTGLQETTHPHSPSSFGTSTTQFISSTSHGTSSYGTSTRIIEESTSTSAGTTTTTTTRGTTVYIPPQTETTIPYKETYPPEPSTTEDESNNEIIPPHQEEPTEYDDNIYEQPIPEPETEAPPLLPPIYNKPNRIDRIDNHNGAGHRDPSIFREQPTRIPPKNKNHGRINSEAEERTAMIIGIVAGALIAVILVILLVLWIKSNGDRSYKMEHDLKYGHGANAALLGHNSGHQSNAHHGVGSHHGNGSGQHHSSSSNQQHHQHNQHHSSSSYQHGNGYNHGSGYDASGESPNGLNGSLRQQQSSHYDRNGMSAGLVQPKAKRNSKDIKEWYV
ncbi:hypothetical protein PVAND_001467 [Polypedilum vanderplanki]|uniref:Laminin G domain-containing protein n=1 Tax=Polypedilum vanderplanki TaxID=319348 RepID=A0A9J6BN14_POLVA|nr:hypothetical protein PVAND_001467 [Polypedilum vanderplanki]